jgi:hypothetical protein
LHLPCASTPYSLRELPGVLSTRRALGTEPSELDLTRIAVAFRPGIPSCDWRNASRVKQTFQPTDDSTSPRLAVTRTNSSDNPKAVPPGSTELPTRFVRTRHCCLRGLASGVSSPRRLGTPLPDFSLWRRPGSLGFTLLGVFPFPCPEPRESSSNPCGKKPALRRHLSSAETPSVVDVIGHYLSGTSGKVPF